MSAKSVVGRFPMSDMWSPPFTKWSLTELL
jgi:hypothetical protein